MISEQNLRALATEIQAVHFVGQPEAIRGALMQLIRKYESPDELNRSQLAHDLCRVGRLVDDMGGDCQNDVTNRNLARAILHDAIKQLQS